MEFADVAKMPMELFSITSSLDFNSSDSAAIVFKRGDLVIVPCAFYLSQYRCIICPSLQFIYGNDTGRRRCKQEASESDIFFGFHSEVISIPHLSILSYEAKKAAADVSCALNATKKNYFQWDKLTGTRIGSSFESQYSLMNMGEREPATEIKVVTLCTKHAYQFQLLLPVTLAEKVCKWIGVYQGDYVAVRKLPAFDVYRNGPEVAYLREWKGKRDGHENLQIKNEDAAADAPSALKEFECLEFGWNLYDPRRELFRQSCTDPMKPIPEITGESAATGAIGRGIDLRPWFQVLRNSTDENQEWWLPTYPSSFVSVPSRTERDYRLAASARAHRRPPAVSYVHLDTGSILSRSSQPMLQSKAIPYDSNLCNSIANGRYLGMILKAEEAQRLDNSAADSGADTVDPDSAQRKSERRQGSIASRPIKITVKVIDCRSKTSAMGNRSMGGGYECGQHYNFCSVDFCGIENVNALSKSFSKVREMVSPVCEASSDDAFLRQLYDSSWMHNIQKILATSVKISECLESGESCLVHCTDGWDRTPECTATAMLLLDPFYRTIIGFCILIEKEFCSFGHKFSYRSGHLQREDSKSAIGSMLLSYADPFNSQLNPQQSPVFLQWLDVVFQIVRQFPSCFEFTTKLLEHLGHHLFSCFYGTFLCDCEQDREVEKVKCSTHSIWTDIVRRAELEKKGLVPLVIVNAQFDADKAWRYMSKAGKNPLSDDGKEGNSGIYRIVPNYSMRRLVFWEECYLRFDGEDLAPSRGCSLERDFKTQKVNWNDELEHYLKKIIEVACEDRLNYISKC